MKNTLTILFLWLFSTGIFWAQVENPIGTKGASPIQDAGISGIADTTYAMIVGISKFADPTVPKLQFAHSDAIEFYQYLRSKAGGSVPESNIRLLLNEDATLAAIDNALNWLLTTTRENNRVIIYFSGHGDVEKQTLWQLGYLLAYDTPYNNYRNNAVRVEDLNDLIVSLSVGTKAKVVVILDACRSGKLAGTDNRGPSLTAEQARLQKANEVRILSCEPDQNSVEGVQWGGGRGLFSFHFINGMMGLADSDANEIITLKEIKNYLSNQGDFDDHQQDPSFEGDNRYTITKVDPEILASVRQGMELAHGEIVAMASAPTQAKGMDALPSASPYEAPVKAFTDFVKNSDWLLEQENNGQWYQGSKMDILKWLQGALDEDLNNSISDPLQKEEMGKFEKLLRQVASNQFTEKQLRQKIAEDFHDEAQAVLNMYLSGDAAEIARRHYADQARVYKVYPLMLKIAMDLLEPSHPLYQKLKLKYPYFDGLGTRITGQMQSNTDSFVQIALQKQLYALEVDDKAAYVHNELGVLYLYQNKLTEAKEHFLKASDLSPTWVLPFSNMAVLSVVEDNLAEAKKYAQKGIDLKPELNSSYINLGVAYERENNLLKAEMLYRKAMDLNTEYYMPFERLAYLVLKANRYEEADRWFYEAEIRKAGILKPMMGETMVLSNFATEDQPFIYTSLSPPGRLFKKPQTVEEFFLTGKYYFEKEDYKSAEPFFHEVMKREPDHKEVYYYLGTIVFGQDRYEEAEIYFKRLVELRPEEPYFYLFIADVYQAWNKLQSEFEIYEGLLEKESMRYDITYKSFNRLFEVLDKQDRYLDKEKWLMKYYAFDASSGKESLRDFYEQMEARFPENMNWLYKHAAFYYFDSEKAYPSINPVNLFEKLLEKDSSYPTAAFIHQILGGYYLARGLEKFKLDDREMDGSWKRPFETSANNFQQSFELQPNWTEPMAGFANACLELYRYDEAMTVLDTLHHRGHLDLDTRLDYGFLQMMAGNYPLAKKLLDKADDYQPRPQARTTDLLATNAMLRGDLKEAARHIEAYLNIENAPGYTSQLYSFARVMHRLGEKEETLNWLNAAIQDGFGRYSYVLQFDPEWLEWRGDPQFEALINR